MGIMDGTPRWPLEAWGQPAYIYLAGSGQSKGELRNICPGLPESLTAMPREFSALDNIQLHVFKQTI